MPTVKQTPVASVEEPTGKTADLFGETIIGLLLDYPGDHDPDAQRPELGSCAGACPDPYQCEPRTTGQRRMLGARVDFCERAIRRVAPEMRGTVSVRADVDEKGDVVRVNVTRTGTVTKAVAACVEQLVGSMHFSLKDGRARTMSESFDLESSSDACRR